MEREDLLAALATFTGEAQAVCVETLSDERSNLNPSDDLTRVCDLLTIYRRRASHVRSINLPTIGFDQAVQQIEATAHRHLRLALSEAATGHPRCVLFVAPESVDIVAALAVVGPPPAI